MLVTDVTMPGEPDGLGLAAQCRDLRPGIPILVATARPPDPVVVPAERILAKPFPVSELVSAVQELLRPLWQTSNDPKAS
jgi:FixJ family two-component response regulator